MHLNAHAARCRNSPRSRMVTSALWHWGGSGGSCLDSLKEISLKALLKDIIAASLGAAGESNAGEDIALPGRCMLALKRPDASVANSGDAARLGRLASVLSPAFGVRPRVLRGFGAPGVSAGVRSKLRTVCVRAQLAPGVAARIPPCLTSAVPGRSPIALGGRGCQFNTSVISPTSFTLPATYSPVLRRETARARAVQPTGALLSEVRHHHQQHDAFSRAVFVTRSSNGAFESIQRNSKRLSGFSMTVILPIQYSIYDNTRSMNSSRNRDLTNNEPWEGIPVLYILNTPGAYMCGVLVPGYDTCTVIYDTILHMCSQLYGTVVAGATVAPHTRNDPGEAVVRLCVFVRS